MKCACGQNASFLCCCNADNQYFCDSCGLTHIKDKRASHNLVSICVESGKEKIIYKLSQTKEKIKEFRGQMLKDLTNLIDLLQGKAKSVLMLLKTSEENLDNFIGGLHNSADFSAWPRISNTLLLDVDLAENECNQWELWNSSLSTARIEEIVETWVFIDDNIINYLQNSENPRNQHVALIGTDIKLAEEGKTCPEGHKLVWSIRSLFENFFRKKSFFCTCKLCNNNFSKSGWSCATCQYDICEQCGLFNGNPAPKLQCKKSHELLTKHDLKAFYNTIEKKNPKKFSICDICKDSKIPSAWHCRECKYEICFTCAFNLDFMQNYSPPVCPKQHFLKETIVPKSFSDTQNIYCIECNMLLKEKMYNCQRCLYNICVFCKEQRIVPTPSHPAICCAEFHLLKWNPKIKIICNLCRGSNGEGFECRECEFHMCSCCADVLENIFRNNFGGVSSCQHKLEYKLVSKSALHGKILKCKACEIKFETKCGGFFCATCKDFYCIECYTGTENIFKAFGVLLSKCFEKKKRLDILKS